MNHFRNSAMPFNFILKKILNFSFLFLLIFFLFKTPLYAIEDPQKVSNNKYGIDIVDENDLLDASFLVNSSGGDWGYVTIVMPENERKIDKWNAIFEKMSELHLIPIVRLATHVEGTAWIVPQKEEANVWADFLNSLKWPIKNRYVVLFNEPNHANEWGGYISPEEYAETSYNFAKELKKRSDEFYVLLAGMDASAPSAQTTMDEEIYLRRMLQTEPSIFDSVDGWASHSYPNPGFSGQVSDNGRKSLQGYKWELALLKNLGITKDFPVFITETGWAHDEYDPDVKLLSPDEITTMITEAANNVWSDPQVIAVTPFILNYQAHPFSQFSWRKQDSSYFYPFFDAYRSIPKLAGSPVLNKKSEIAGIETIKSDNKPSGTPSPSPVSEIKNKKSAPDMILDKVISFFKNLSNKFG